MAAASLSPRPLSVTLLQFEAFVVTTKEPPHRSLMLPATHRETAELTLLSVVVNPALPSFEKKQPATNNALTFQMVRLGSFANVSHDIAKAVLERTHV